MTDLSSIRSNFPFWAGASAVLVMALAGCTAGRGAGHEVEGSLEEMGLAYAREACASCHAVEVGQALSPNVAAPSFETLAHRPDMTRAALSALLRSPHRNMPSLIVAPDRIDDLAAYFSVLQDRE